ncbi:hypothetical protein B7494_g4007 [Chlorociboria aeruginascens]|nr:hypothetical protein B7494_g4007 [Chlorociboria aeruginascens]
MAGSFSLNRSFTRNYLLGDDSKAKDAQARSDKKPNVNGGRSSTDNRASTDGRLSNDGRSSTDGKFDEYTSDEEAQGQTQTYRRSRGGPNNSISSVSSSHGLLIGETVSWTDDNKSDLLSKQAEQLFKPPPRRRGETVKNDNIPRRDNERHGDKRQSEEGNGAAANSPNT